MEMPCQDAQGVVIRAPQGPIHSTLHCSFGPCVSLLRSSAQRSASTQAHQKQFINILLKGELFQKYLRSDKIGIIGRKARGCQGLSTQKHSFSTIFTKGE